MKRVIRPWFELAAVAASLAILPQSAGATVVDDHLRGNLVDVRVRVESRFTPLYTKSWSWGGRRRYFEAIEGGRYAVELHNLTDRRIGVVMSVDGLNVLNGQRSSLAPSEGMYVLDPYQRAEIRGWRTSLDDVRQFVFVDEQSSYATRTGQANGDMGWIRVNTFEEQRPLAWGGVRMDYGGGGGSPAPAPPAREPAEDHAKDERRSGAESDGGRKQSAPAPRTEGLAQDQESGERSGQSFPGTGWGDRREDHVTRVEFHAMASPSDELVLRYEYADGLRQLGIEPRHRRVWDREDGQLGFAKAPRW